MSRRADAPYRRVYEDGRVVWIARYRHPITGRREYAHPKWNRGKSTFALKRDAQQAINEAIDTALLPESRTDTVAGYAARWLELHPRGERTNKTHEHRLSRLLEVEVDGTTFGHMKLTDVGLRHANLLYDHLLRQGRALRGAKGILSTFSAMFEDAVRDELAATNPFRGVVFRKNDPRIQKAAKEPTIWTFREMHFFAGVALELFGLETQAMIRVLSDCGLRLGEMLALTRDGFTGTHLYVLGTAHEGRIVSVEGETKKHHRKVPVPDELARILAVVTEHSEHGLLFPTDTGRVWRESNFYRDIWTPTREKAGLDIRPHDMRHSYLTQLEASGINLADLAHVAGHNVQTLINTYTHPLGRSDDKIREAVR
jgi:integrase